MDSIVDALDKAARDLETAQLDGFALARIYDRIATLVRVAAARHTTLEHPSAAAPSRTERAMSQAICAIGLLYGLASGSKRREVAG